MHSVSSGSPSVPNVGSSAHNSPGSASRGHVRRSSTGSYSLPSDSAPSSRLPSRTDSPVVGSPARRSSLDSSVSSVDSAAHTPGLRPPATKQPDLDNMNVQELSQLGNERLDAAKSAYKKYGEINIAQQAQQALQSFVEACTDNSDDRAAMIAALKAITLPSDAPTDLSVAIKFPGLPTVSLIPPDDKQLSDATPEDITKWYKMAMQAMGNWSQENAKTADALAAAKQLLDDAVASLKAVRETIDRKTREITKMPGQSQLEVEYQRFVDQGITIHFDSNADSIEATGTPNSA